MNDSPCVLLIGGQTYHHEEGTQRVYIHKERSRSLCEERYKHGVSAVTPAAAANLRVYLRCVICVIIGHVVLNMACVGTSLIGSWISIALYGVVCAQVCTNNDNSRI